MPSQIAPDRRRRLGNLLMAEQWNRPTPQDSSVVERAGMLPLATYANGQTGPAFPGFVTEPVAAWQRMLSAATDGEKPSPADSFDVAGATMAGGFVAKRPRGSLGMGGHDEGFPPDFWKLLGPVNRDALREARQVEPRAPTLTSKEQFYALGANREELPASWAHMPGGAPPKDWTTWKNYQRANDEWATGEATTLHANGSPYGPALSLLSRYYGSQQQQPHWSDSMKKGDI